jgi:hypothetical protein
MTVSRRGDFHHSQFEPAKAVVILMSLVDARRPATDCVRDQCRTVLCHYCQDRQPASVTSTDAALEAERLADSWSKRKTKTVKLVGLFAG